MRVAALVLWYFGTAMACLALLVLLALFGGCAGIRPCVCNCADLTASASYMAQRQRAEAQQRAWVLADADEAAQAKADEERDAREAAATFELFDLQSRLENTVKP